MLLMILGLNTVAIVIISVLIFRQSKKVKGILNNRYPPKFIYYDEISKVYREINSLSEEIRKMRLDKTSEISGDLMSEELYKSQSITSFQGDSVTANKYSSNGFDLMLNEGKHKKYKQSEFVNVDVFSTTGEFITTKRIELQTVSHDI